MKKGFTLLELLIVMAVIGLLSSIILVGYKGQTEKARLARTLEWASSINHLLGFNTAGAWTFDRITGTTVYDDSSNKNNGTIYGGATVVDGVVGKALSFDGVNDYVDCGTGSSLDLTTAAITVEAWVYSKSGSYALCFVAKDDLASGRSWYFGMNDSTSFKAALWTTSGRKDITMSGFNLNEWTHVAFTYDGSNEYLYKNGVRSSPVSQTGNIVSNPSTKVTIGSLSTSYFFNGMIDDVRIFSEALPRAQIEQLYAEGLQTHRPLAKQ